LYPGLRIFAPEETTVSTTSVRADGLPRAPARGNPRLALLLIVVTQAMVVLDGTVVNIALPDIQRALDFSSTSLSWVITIYTLTFGGLLLLGGRAGDILGRRRVFIAGVVVFTAASLLGGLAPSSGWLLAARALQGVGAALAAPSTLALIATTFREGRERSQALGLFAAVSAGGASLGLILGGALTAWVSWRWVLFVNVPFGVAVALLAPRAIVESERQPGRFDLAGALAGTVGMTSLVYGFIRAASDGWSDGLTIGAFLTAGVLLVAFVLVELRAEQPIVPLRLFADRNHASGYAAMLLLVAAMFGMFFFLTQFLQEARGFSALEAGLAFLPLTVGIFGASRVVPRLLPRYSPRALLGAGAPLIVAGMLWLTQIDAGTEYATGLLGPMLLFGLGVGLVFVPLNVLILTGVAPRDSGAASGLLQTMQQVGGSLGLAILVTVSQSASDGAASGRETLIEGATTAFAAGSVFALATCLVILFGFRRGPAVATA
jgi:EmrB/QacA subfamily drug resistance transporter